MKVLKSVGKVFATMALVFTIYAVGVMVAGNGIPGYTGFLLTLVTLACLVPMYRQEASALNNAINKIMEATAHGLRKMYDILRGTEIQADVEELDAECEGWKDRYDTQVRVRLAMEDTVEELKRKNQELKRKNQDLKAYNTDLKTAAVDTTVQSESVLEDEIEELKLRKVELLQKIEQLEKELKETISQRDERTRAYAELNGELTEAKKKVEDWEAWNASTNPDEPAPNAPETQGASVGTEGGLSIAVPKDTQMVSGTPVGTVDKPEDASEEEEASLLVVTEEGFEDLEDDEDESVI